MRVLLVDESADIRRLARLMLEKRWGAEVEEAQGLQTALRIIKEQPRFDCVISDAQESEASAAELLQLVRQHPHPPLFILCSATPIQELSAIQPADLDGYLPKHELAQKLLPLLQSLFKAQVGAPEERHGDYVPLPMSLVSRIDRMPTHVYLHLGHRYVHVFREGDTLQPNDIQKYVDKGLKILHVKLDDLEKFTDAFFKNHVAAATIQQPVRAADVRKASETTQDSEKKAALAELARIMEKAKQVSLGVGDLIPFTEEAYSTVQRALGVLDVTPDIESAIRATVQLALESVRDTPLLKESFDTILSRSEKSAGLHSVVIGHAACRIADRMGWKSPATRYKLCLASFLHDLTLRSERVAGFADYEEFLLEAGSLTPEEKAQYENHPLDAAELALKMSMPPPDMDLILSQHHELPSGEGFPNKIQYQAFHPLAAVFVIAEDWVLYIQREGHNSSLAGFAKSRAARYDYPLFREMLLKLREEA